MIGGDIYDSIIKVLKENGDIDDQTFRQYVLFVLVDLGKGRREIEQIKKKVEKLERNSLLLVCKRHPKVAFSIVTFLAVFIFVVIAKLGIWEWVAEWFKVPIP